MTCGYFLLNRYISATANNKQYLNSLMHTIGRALSAYFSKEMENHRKQNEENCFENTKMKNVNNIDV